MLDMVAPSRLGRSFRWLFGSVLASNLGDGILVAAGPLLVASQTRDPFVVASAFFLQKLPWLLFGVVAGALVDRLDRRLVIVTVDLLRALVLLVLVAFLVSGTVTVAVVLVTLFLLGTAETFADIVSATLVVGMVERSDLGVGNARLHAGFILSNQFAGPPLGAFLFAVGWSLPFGTAIACSLLSATLVARISLRPQAPRDPDRSMRAEIAEGMRWLWQHPAVRTLAITIVLFNVTFGAAWGVLVLYSQERLGMSEAGFGLLMTSAAVGGLLGTSAYGWLERTVGLADLMRIGLVLETLTHLGLALTTSQYVAMAVLLVFGAHAFVWHTTVQTVRQRSVPYELQGRVGSVYMIGSFTGLLVGSPLGGVLARQWGLTAPFWFGFAGSALLVALLWAQFGHLVRDAEQQNVGPAP